MLINFVISVRKNQVPTDMYIVKILSSGIDTVNKKNVNIFLM